MAQRRAPTERSGRHDGCHAAARQLQVARWRFMLPLGGGYRTGETPVGVEEGTMARRLGLTRRQWARGLSSVGAMAVAGGFPGLLAACSGTGAPGAAPKPAVPKADI